MLKLFLWLRYLGKKKVVLLSIAAVALSCALLIVVASLFNGFIDAFERSAVDAIGDVVLAPPVKFEDYRELIERLEAIGTVEAATATLTTQGLLHLGKGNVRAVEIWGIEVQKRGRVTAFERSLLKGGGQTNKPQLAADSQPMEGGSTTLTTGYVGIGILAEPDEKTDEYDFNAVGREVGREAVLTTGAADGGQEGGQPFRRRTLRLVIADVVFTGVYELDSRIVYLPIEQLQEVLYHESGPVAGQIQIKLIPGCNEAAALARIREVWEAFASQHLGWEPHLILQTSIETARQMQSRYVAEFRKQMGILLLIFGAVSLSAVLLIFCIFYMIVETRRKDIAIVKSCGAGSGSVALLFVEFGGCVGIIGAAAGTVLGYFITKNINTVEEWIRVIFGLKLWKSSVYMLSRIPTEVDWQAVIWIALSAVAGAAIGAAVPAVSAAMTRPVNVLRYE